RHFVVGRGPQLDNVIDPWAATPTRLGCYAADDKPFEALRVQIDETVARGGWTIFMIHGVGRDHRLQVDREVHARLLAYLVERAVTVWTAPVVEVGGVVAAGGDGG